MAELEPAERTMKPSPMDTTATDVFTGWKRFIPPLVIFLFVNFVFLPTLAAGFIDLDDVDFLVNNPNWKGFTAEHARWMVTDMSGHYMPLTWISFAVNYEFGGMSPFGYHLANNLVHAMNTVLVFWIGMRLIGAASRREGGAGEGGVLSPVQVRLGAGIGAMVWGAHPMRVESVAWVTERRDVLSTMFLLWAVLAYLRMTGLSAGRGRVRWYLASIVLLCLSLLSKSWGMSFFVIVLILDVYPLGRLPLSPRRWMEGAFRPVLIEKAPYIVLGVGFAVLAALAQKAAPGAMRTLEQWPISARIAQSAYGLVFYVWKSIVPSGHSPLYELPRSVNPFEFKFVASYALVAAGVAACVLLARRRPAIPASAAAYAVVVAPVLGLLQSGETFVADRYSYVSCISWSVLFGAGVAHLVRLARRREGGLSLRPGLVMVGVGAILLTYGVLTVNQATAWRDSLALWEDAVSGGVTTPGVRVNYGLNLERWAQDEGRVLSNQERVSYTARAVEQYQMAVAADPENGRGWFVLGITLRRLGRLQEAEHAFAQAAQSMPQKYMALVNRGNLLMNDLGRQEEGLECLRAAVADIERPRTRNDRWVKLSGMPHLALGAALKKTGDVSGARESFRKALDHPDSKAAGEAELRALEDGQ